MQTKTIKCPTCKKEIPYDLNNEFRPFCCERCKLIDIADWATESHRIPGEQIRNEADIPDPDSDTELN